MSPTPIRDPNAPPDPSELREIPDAQHPAGWDVNPHNPVPQPPVDTPPDMPSAELPIAPPPEPAPVAPSKAEQPPAKKK